VLHPQHSAWLQQLLEALHCSVKALSLLRLQGHQQPRTVTLSRHLLTQPYTQQCKGNISVSKPLTAAGRQTCSSDTWHT
jgi:hypothetical protein